MTLCLGVALAAALQQHLDLILGLGIRLISILQTLAADLAVTQAQHQLLAAYVWLLMVIT